VLPHVELQQRHRRLRRVALLIEQLLDDQATPDRVPRQHTPTRTLNSHGCGGEVGDELVERAKELIDRGREFALGLVSAIRRQVRPEDRVVDVTTEVESQVFLETVDVGERAGRAGLGHGFECTVGARDVGRVVLRVVQLHDASADVRLERGVVVAELGKRVDRHESELSSW
jgi:hypothetical protein